MLLGVVSDTHGHRANTQAAVRMLESLEPNVVIHCGDIGSPAIPGMFQAWETHFVLGNVDQNEETIEAIKNSQNHRYHGLFGSLELEGKSVAFLHGHERKRFQQAAHSGDWDLVCYGHTHQAEHHHEDDTLVLNPGAIYRARPHSIAVVELPLLQVTIVPL